MGCGLPFSMSKDHFLLTAAEALPNYRLHLTYADGQNFEMDLSDWINTTQALAALKDKALFA